MAYEPLDSTVNFRWFLYISIEPHTIPMIVSIYFHGFPYNLPGCCHNLHLTPVNFQWIPLKCPSQFPHLSSVSPPGNSLGFSEVHDGLLGLHSTGEADPLRCRGCVRTRAPLKYMTLCGCMMVSDMCFLNDGSMIVWCCFFNDVLYDWIIEGLVEVLW